MSALGIFQQRATHLKRTACQKRLQRSTTIAVAAARMVGGKSTGVIKASVQGSRLYRVHIDLSTTSDLMPHGQVHCTCPDSSYACKHSLAVVSRYLKVA